MSHKQRACLLSLLWLCYGVCGMVSATSTLTVNLNDTEPGRVLTIKAPTVCNVAFLPGSYDEGCNDNKCTFNVANNRSFERTFKSRSNPTNTVKVTVNFDPDLHVSCSMYTPHVHLSNINSVMFSCSPLFACNATPSIDVNQIIWRKFYYLDNLTDYITSRNVSSFSDYVLVHGRYRPPANITDSTLFTNMSLADKGQELRVVVNGGVERSGTEALGYYVPTVELNNQWTGIGPHTVVYIEPNLESEGGSDEIVVQGSGRGRNFNKIYCIFRSFPPVSVIWISPGDSNFTTRDIVGSSTATYVDLELTHSGEIFFKEVQFDDGGHYKCIGDNGVSSTMPSHTTILRVRDPLRPLWPALGIVCSLIITALFILGGTLVDKIRGKNSTTDDEGSFQRNYSVVSNMGDDTNNATNSRRGHTAAKRVSSSTQELLPNAS